MIQLGYRIIAPRDVSIDEDSRGPDLARPNSLKKLKAFERVVMSYDRFGFINFVRSRESSHVHDFGRLLVRTPITTTSPASTEKTPAIRLGR